MKKNIIIAISVIVFFLIVLALIFSGKPEESKPTFKGPSGAPSVRGPYGPPPSN